MEGIWLWRTTCRMKTKIVVIANDNTRSFIQVDMIAGDCVFGRIFSFFSPSISIDEVELELVNGPLREMGLFIQKRVMTSKARIV